MVLVGAGLLLGLAAPARADEPSTDDEAKRHFMAGVAYLEDKEGERYEDAYNEFKTAFTLSHAAKVLGNLGLCAMKLERDGEAIDAYGQYLAEVSDIDPEERAQIEHDLTTLKQGVVRVSVVSHEAAGALFDTRYASLGAPVSNVYDVSAGKHELRVRPGHHLLVLKVGGQERGRWEFTVGAGSTASHDFVSSEQRPAPARSRVGPIVTMAIGGATLGAAGVLGAITLTKVHHLESNCPNGGCGAVEFGEVDRTRTLVRVTDTLFLAGGVVAAAGLAWFVLASPTSRSSGSTASAACAEHGCMATFRTGF
jgi:hypothetical protein